MTKRRILLGLACAAVLLQGATVAAQEAFPNRVIRIVVPAPPGQGADTLARLVAQKITEQTGHAIFVENKPGGNMIIGSTEVAHARPDGYTLLMSGTTASTAAALSGTKLQYDPIASFTPVSGLAMNGYVLAVPTDFPANTVADLVALAKKEPGKLTYASGNQSGRMAAELFQATAGINLLHVPYQGTPQALLDLSQGRVSVMLNGTMTTRPFVDRKQVKVLGISSTSRDPVYPDTPPIAETVKGYSFVAWQGLMAPAGTPPATIATLNRLVTNALNDSALKAKLTASGLMVWPASPAEVTKTAREELASWRELDKRISVSSTK
jgi:tripartite-type tricarboxylate transporter receptor subunit TctC